MTCSECQLQIFDGELSRDATVHLTECEDCRELDREVHLNTSALAQMREDPLPISAAPLAPRRWPQAVLAAAAAAITFLMVSHEEPKLPPPPVPVAKLMPVPTPVLPPAAPAPKSVHHRPPAAKPQPKPEPPEQPLLVKFITDDPDVVVYWIVDNNQGEPGL